MTTVSAPPAGRAERGLDPSVDYLAQRVALLDRRVRAAVDQRRSVDPDPDDRFRGLYIPDSEVDDLLDAPGRNFVVVTPDPTAEAEMTQVEAAADEAERAGAVLRLRQLARTFQLDALDVELFLIALAPDLDPRFERLYAYLQDDVSRRRASTGLALELCGTPMATTGERHRFDPTSPLVASGLLLVEEPDRPFLTRPLRVPDRVASHLLGHDSPDSLVEPVLTACVEADIGDVDVVARALEQGAWLVYLRERTGAAGQALAAGALRRVGRPALAVDLHRLRGDDPRSVASAAGRDARLRGAGLIVGPVEAVAEDGPAAVRAWAEAGGIVLLIGARAWDPAWSRDVPLVVDAAVPTLDERATLWLNALNNAAHNGCDPGATTMQFRLTPEQVHRAARAACQQAAAEDRRVATGDIHRGARAQNAAGLERLARRIEPEAGWDELVLPDPVLAQLEELTARARHRDLVLDGWRMGRRSSKGRGITALFAGDSGTGKTMSAEVVAGDLGLDLYVIDLSTVVDKYIGETEKNLDRIFVEADRVNGVLLFDEADAIFGKRSEVKDSHDRYANVEVAFLLQRMELFDGLAILTTNLRSNVDEAFTRRLDTIVDFPMPEEEDRRRLWESHLRPELPKSDDIDLDFLASAFRLSGGNIRNVAVAAAYSAARHTREVTMSDLIRGTAAEYRKLGHLCTESEFGDYFSFVVPRG